VKIYREAAPAVVLLVTKDASGSGVVLQSGMIITNRHVVEGVGTLQVFFKPEASQSTNGAPSSEGSVKLVDPSRDLALVELAHPPSDMKFLRIAQSDDLEVGSDVYAIGHPLGYTWTFTQGVVSGVREIKDNGQNYTAIQTQTPINPGNSGGPLLNSSGEVVGINTWIRDISDVNKVEVSGQNVTVARPAQGLNFAVSAKDIRNFLSDVATGKISNMTLKLPDPPAGCSWQTKFSGRTKENNADLRTFSSKCDDVSDAWEIFPDDKSKAVELYIDAKRAGKSSIVVYSDPNTGKWKSSLWDFYQDQSFAVIGYHDDGDIKPSRFAFRN
jgi:hypothetical protein